MHILHVGPREGTNRGFQPFWSKASELAGTFEWVDIGPETSFRELQNLLKWHLKKAAVDLMVLHWDKGISAAIWATTGSRTRVAVHRYSATVLDPATVKRVSSARVASFVVPTNGASMLVQAAGVPEKRIHPLWMSPTWGKESPEMEDVIEVYAPSGRSGAATRLKTHMDRHEGPTVRISTELPLAAKVVVDVLDQAAPSPAIAEALQRGATALIRDTLLNRLVYNDQVLYYTDSSLPEMVLRALSSRRAEPLVGGTPAALSKLYQEASL